MKFNPMGGLGELNRFILYLKKIDHSYLTINELVDMDIYSSRSAAYSHYYNCKRSKHKSKGTFAPRVTYIRRRRMYSKYTIIWFIKRIWRKSTGRKYYVSI